MNKYNKEIYAAIAVNQLRTITNHETKDKISPKKIEDDSHIIEQQIRTEKRLSHKAEFQHTS